MVTLRPGLSSYARVAYARELTGDPVGALAAMRLALDAAAGQPEPTAFALVEIAKLELGLARTAAALAPCTELHFAYFPDIRPRGWRSRGSKRRAGESDRALAEARRAAEAIPTQAAIALYAELLDRAGRRDEARRQRGTIAVIDRLLEANGVQVDLESAVHRADYRIQPVRTVALGEAGSRCFARPSTETTRSPGRSRAPGAATRRCRWPRARSASARRTRSSTSIAATRRVAPATGRRCGSGTRRALELNPEFSLRWAPVARAAVR